MTDRFDEGWVDLDPFAVIFDKDGKPVGVMGTSEGEQIVQMGDVELTMVAEGDSFTLTKIHVNQKSRRLCCQPGKCKTN